VNAKHRKTLAAVFAKPTLACVVFSDIEALVKAPGGPVTEREGSRVKVELFERAGEQTMNSMTHGGYTARIEFDERNNVFVGRILGLRSIISFHGETVAQLRREFAAAVKDYLNDCKAQGVEPEKPASGKLLLRMPPEIHSRAIVVAQAKGKSLNQWATEALQRAVADA